MPKMLMAVIALTLISLAAPTHAQQGQFYGTLFAGLNFTNDQVYSGPDGLSFEDDSDTGGLIGGALGYDFGFWRGELEIAQRFNGEDSFFVNDPGLDPALAGVAPGSPIADGSADLNATSFMMNALVDFTVNYRLELFFGGGVGALRSVLEEFEGPGGPLVDDDDFAFAGQAIAGARYAFGSNYEVSAGYRYIAAIGEDWALNNGGTLSGNYGAHAFTVGIGIRFLGPL